MIRLLTLICSNDGNNLQKDSDNSYPFARGFDDFVTTWPPSTNTTSMNDDNSNKNLISIPLITNLCIKFKALKYNAFYRASYFMKINFALLSVMCSSLDVAL
ncbi:unnamed protein product [Rotaria sp. Silwood2]|nr:unnamed protein product [Rotaria sp. Silwood2]